MVRGPEPGWFPDPNFPGRDRYWGGVAWTDNYRPTAPPPPPPAEREESGLVTLGYVTAALLPVVGFILGIVAMTRPGEATRRHGVPIVLVSILAFAVWYAVLAAP